MPDSVDEQGAERIPPYKSKRSDPGLFVEIYMPKRPELQGLLNGTLAEGFDINNIKTFLKEHERYVRHMLQERRDITEKYDSVKENLTASLAGYSMYEVDGVFSGVSGEVLPDIFCPPGGALEGQLVSNNFEINKGPKFIHERVQVVRLMFLPGLEDMVDADISFKDADDNIKACVKWYVRQFLMSHQTDIYTSAMDCGCRKGLLSNIPDCGKINNESLYALFERIVEWVNHVKVVVLGYVVTNICLQMQEHNFRPEEEIWVTSLRHISVSRFIFTGSWKKCDQCGRHDLVYPIN